MTSGYKDLCHVGVIFLTSVETDFMGTDNTRGDFQELWVHFLLQTFNTMKNVNVQKQIY